MPATCKRFSAFLLILALLSGLQPTHNSSAQSLTPRPEQGYLLFFPELTFTIPPEWLGPEGGLISAIVFNRQDPAVLYAGSWGGGVYQSKDGGASWERASQGLGNLVVVSMAIDPGNPNTLYAGTYRGKIWKSIDAGASWSLASNGIQEEAIVYSIVIDPQNTQRIYAATRAYNHIDRPWLGVVYRSEDGGANWAVSLGDLGGSDYQDWVYSLEINPSRPNVIFGASHEHGPVRSSDYGSTWKVLTNGITNKSTRAIVVDPRQDYADYVYTGVWTKSGVFKSNDGGGTWELKDEGITGANIYSMSINPFAPKTLFAGTYNMGVMRSTNGANSWASTGLKQIGIATVRVNPTNSQIVYSGTAGDGLFVSADGGSNWRHSQANLKASNVTGVVVTGSNPSSLFAGVYGSGVMSSSDQGKTWTEFSPNIDDSFINALVQSPDRSALFALSENAGLFRCDLNNLAACWQNIEFRSAAANSIAAAVESQPPESPVAGYQSYLQALGVQPEDRSPSTPGAVSASGAPLTLAFAPSNPGVAYLGTRDTGVFRSTDGGLTWSPTGWTGHQVVSLTVDPTDPVIVTGSANLPGVIYQSQDSGSHWTDIGIPDVTAYALQASPMGQNSLWAGTSNGVYAFTNGQWTVSGLAGQSVLSLALYPGKSNLLLAGTTSGVRISKDGGSTWFEGPAQLEGIPVQAISFDANDAGVVYYCTSAHGLLRAYLERSILQP